MPSCRSSPAERPTRLISYCRSKLSEYKRPKSIEFMADLPKNAYGKVLKRKLRECALERLSADRLPGTDQMTSDPKMRGL